MTPDTPVLVGGTTRLFAERTASLRLDLDHDEHGFLRPSSRFLSAAELCDRPCSLVVAPPWVGKTFTAKRLRASLMPGPGTKPKGIPAHCELTDLELWASGQPLTPGWWGGWRRSARRATWIIDALDEGQRRDASLCPRLIRALSDLSPGDRRRLRLIIFARDRDLRQVASAFEPNLREVFADGFLAAELLPLDAGNARELIGAGADWQRVLDLIAGNRLQAVAGYPAVLSFLARQRGAVELSIRDIWKGVLQQLLEEHPYSYRTQPFQTEPEARFAASARIAAVLTLAGRDELTSSPACDQPTLHQIISLPTPGHQIATRDAAREALRSTMFRSTAEGSRFLHRNVREWMAAFGMARLPLAKLRPVLQDTAAGLESPASIRPELGDLAQLLALVHAAAETRDWIVHALGHLPAPSDLFVASLGTVRRILDRLEQLASTGAHLPSIDDRTALETLVVAGLGKELATRLADTRRPAPVRVMLLRIGSTLDLDTVLAQAAAIVADVSQDSDLRSWCASALGRAPRADHLRAVEAFLESAAPTSLVETEVVSTLASAFLDHGLWTAERAFRSLPRGSDSQVITATRALPYTLARRMTAEDAETIVASLSPPAIEELNHEAAERYRAGHWSTPPRWHAYAAAVRTLAAIEPADPARLRPLLPFALSLEIANARQEPELLPLLLKALRTSDISRRELVEAGVARPRVEKADVYGLSWWLYRVLVIEDLAWLVGRLPELAKDRPEVWQVALHLAGEAEPKMRRRVRALARRHAPSALSDHKRALAAEKALERPRRMRRAQEETAMRHIEDVDRQLLADPGNLSGQQVFWQLSWVNYSGPPFQPRNLIGGWSDLSPALQRQVLDTSAAALDSLPPTPIPEGSTYPSVLQYEAQAFVAQLRLDPDRFQLNRARIERWLPAVLKTFHRERAGLLEACQRLEPETTETIVLEAVGRELREPNSYSVLRIPVEGDHRFRPQGDH